MRREYTVHPYLPLVFFEKRLDSIRYDRNLILVGGLLEIRGETDI